MSMQIRRQRRGSVIRMGHVVPGGRPLPVTWQTRDMANLFNQQFGRKGGHYTSSPAEGNRTRTADQRKPTSGEVIRFRRGFGRDIAIWSEQPGQMRARLRGSPHLRGRPTSQPCSINDAMRWVAGDGLPAKPGASGPGILRHAREYQCEKGGRRKRDMAIDGRLALSLRSWSSLGTLPFLIAWN